MENEPLISWLKEWLLERFPGNSLIESMPNPVLSAILVPVLLLAIGFFLNKLFESSAQAKKGYTSAWRWFTGDSDNIPAPATAEDLTEIKNKIDALYKILTPDSPNTSESLSSEGAAMKSALVNLVNEGTPTAKTAVNKLEQGEISQGFDLLEQEARSNESDALEKWRRLGTLALSVDTARALSAFEKAYRLDPDDYFTCTQLARVRQKAGNIKAAIEAAKAADRLANNEHKHLLNHVLSANILKECGDLLAAKDRLEAGLKIAEQQIIKGPSSKENQTEMSVVLGQLGEVQLHLGDTKGAISRFTASLKIRDSLAHEKTDDDEAQRALSLGLAQVGNVMLETGDLSGARAKFEKSLVVLERLDKKIDSSETKRDLSWKHIQLGDVLIKIGDLKGARTCYEQSLKLTRTLAEQNLGSAEAKRDLLVNLGALGSLLLDAGDVMEARKNIEESLKISKYLAKRNPGSTHAQIDLSLALQRHSNVLIAEEELPIAIESLKESVKVIENLAKKNPENLLIQQQFFLRLIGYGDLLLKTGDLVGAKARFRASLEISRRLSESNPLSTQAKRHTSVCKERLADTLILDGEHDEALTLLTERLRIAEELLLKSPESGEAQRDLAVSHERLGGLLLKEGDLDRSMDHFQACLEFFRSSGVKKTNVLLLRSVAMSLERLGSLFIERGDIERGKINLQESIGFLERLAENGPESAYAQRDLMVGYAKLGEVAPYQGWWQKSLEVCKRLAYQNLLLPTDRDKLLYLITRAAADKNPTSTS